MMRLYWTISPVDCNLGGGHINKVNQGPLLVEFDHVAPQSRRLPHSSPSIGCLSVVLETDKVFGMSPTSCDVLGGLIDKFYIYSIW